MQYNSLIEELKKVLPLKKERDYIILHLNNGQDLYIMYSNKVSFADDYLKIEAYNKFHYRSEITLYSKINSIIIDLDNEAKTESNFIDEKELYEKKND